MMKNILIIVLVILVGGFGAYFLIRSSSRTTDVAKVRNATTSITSPQDNNQTGETPATELDKEESTIGKSVEGRDITAYHYGTGSDIELLFVGGIHGGYSWNTALVAYEAMNYLKTNPNIVPENIKVTVIPVLNPDGLYKVVGTSTAGFTRADVSPSQAVQISGRFNANNVDLNRNFDCDWQINGKWQSKIVSGGNEVFSEPESQAIKNYIETKKPKAVVVWYSAAGGVFASSCHNGVSSETNTITKKFADASGYPAYESFDFYTTTGDMANWLAKSNIPAISVILTNHTDTEWTKNQAGIDALLKYYAK